MARILDSGQDVHSTTAISDGDGFSRPFGSTPAFSEPLWMGPLVTRSSSVGDSSEEDSDSLSSDNYFTAPSDCCGGTESSSDGDFVFSEGEGEGETGSNNIDLSSSRWQSLSREEEDEFNFEAEIVSLSGQRSVFRSPSSSSSSLSGLKCGETTVFVCRHDSRDLSGQESGFFESNTNSDEEGWDGFDGDGEYDDDDDNDANGESGGLHCRIDLSQQDQIWQDFQGRAPLMTNLSPTTCPLSSPDVRSCPVARISKETRTSPWATAKHSICSKPPVPPTSIASSLLLGLSHEKRHRFVQQEPGNLTQDSRCVVAQRLPCVVQEQDRLAEDVVQRLVCIVQESIDAQALEPGAHFPTGLSEETSPLKHWGENPNLCAGIERGKTNGLCVSSAEVSSEQAPTSPVRHHSRPSSSGGSSRHVRFKKGKELATVHYMCTWQFAHRACRRGDWDVVARDRERFRKRIAEAALVLEPCLASKLKWGALCHRRTDVVVL